MTEDVVTRVPRLAAVVVSTALLGACAVGPDYKRPEMRTPDQYRFIEVPVEVPPEGPAAAASLADEPFWAVFGDTALLDLIHEAIENNLDLKTAAARVEESRAIAGVAKSFLFPELNVTGAYGAQQTSRTAEPPQDVNGDRTFHNWNAGFTLSWEIDIFGRVRRQNEAAFARYLATEQGRRGVLITLVGDVASDYFLLRQLDRQLEIANDTLRLNDETVAYYRNRLEGGVSNQLELDQSIANRAITAAAIPDLERQIALVENGLSVLLGRVPGPIVRGAALDAQTFPPTIPAGLPAKLLERRPDVVEAEELLVGANADIGAAKALFFPTISLTGLLGVVSGDLSNVLKSDATVWNLSAGLFQPIFQAGRIKRNYEAALARNEQALAQYRKAALNGYREVADSLVTIQKLAVAKGEIETGVEALRDASKLSRSRYDNGLSNYLEILIADQQLFQQELDLARTLGDQHRAIAQLYRALGGGWGSGETQHPDESAGDKKSP
jgi:multidrug efflux system outer membrane protein